MWVSREQAFLCHSPNISLPVPLEGCETSATCCSFSLLLVVLEVDGPFNRPLHFRDTLFYRSPKCVADVRALSDVRRPRNG